MKQKINVINSKKCTIALLVLLFGHSLLHAQIVTDRPDQTESSLVVGKNNLQLESGVLLSYQGFTSNPTLNIRSFKPNNLFRYGISENLELRLLHQYESFRFGEIDIKGVNDLEVGAKYNLTKDSSPTQIALLGHLIFPSGTEGLSREEYGFMARILVSHPLKNGWSIGYNIGTFSTGDEAFNLLYTLSLAKSVSERVGFFVEPYGQWLDLDIADLNFNTGFVYQVKDHVQVDFSFGTGITTRSNFLSFGCSWLIQGK